MVEKDQSSRTLGSPGLCHMWSKLLDSKQPRSSEEKTAGEFQNDMENTRPFKLMIAFGNQFDGHLRLHPWGSAEALANACALSIPHPGHRQIMPGHKKTVRAGDAQAEWNEWNGNTS